ncbi:MAG: hypothetical protein IPL65_01995 [Lewinellaceae bacterium]|nr:hypothetical protein [Lewinellaceae bacterium]
METLREVIQILDRYKVREIDVITNPPKSEPELRKENRYFELYAGIREGRWANEEEIALHFGMEAASKKFQRFKNETRKRLYNSILFIDTTLPDFNDYNRAYANLMQQWAVAKSLQHRGARQAFLEIAENALRVAIQFEYVDIAFEILKSIKSSIIPYPQFQKTYLQRKEQYEQYKALYLAELLARESYEGLILPLTRKKGFRREHAEEARQLLLPLKPYAAKVDTVVFQYYYRIIDLYASILEHNWEAAYRKAREAKDFFISKPFEPLFCIIAFSHQIAGALIMLNRFEEAQTECRELLPLLSDLHSNWFKTNELLVVCLMYSGKYSEAWEIQKSILRNKNFTQISSMDQESWLVVKGYLSLLAKANVLQLSPREKGDVENFRLSSWLNDLPLFSQDKRGANIPVLIAQAMFLLLDQRFEEFDNRVEALRKYRQRNLDAGSEHHRTNCFIRLLELIPKNGYVVCNIEKEAGAWLEKMSGVSSDIIDRSYELEVVPYERQWRWILGILDGKGMGE